MAVSRGRVLSAWYWLKCSVFVVEGTKEWPASGLCHESVPQSLCALQSHCAMPHLLVQRTLLTYYKSKPEAPYKHPISQTFTKYTPKPINTNLQRAQQDDLNRVHPGG